MYESSGTLRVRIFTAGGALPISDAVIRLFGSDEENLGFAASRITDRDGVSVFSELPAPPIKYSMAPNPTERPFSTYRMEVFAEGYSEKLINEVTVFSGIESYQPVNLLPKL